VNRLSLKETLSVVALHLKNCIAINQRLTNADSSSFIDKKALHCQSIGRALIQLC
jgi:hypothetical protein